jgi:peptide/nickel transport system substrate-binding protein
MRIGIPKFYKVKRATARFDPMPQIRRGFAAYRALSRKERMIFSGVLALTVVGIIGGFITLYLRATVPLPTYGGSITEGVVGKPFAINPLIPDGSPADSALEQLIYSALLKADGKGGVMPDLAEEYEILENGKQYIVSLRPSLKWHDNKPLTTEDILFTAQLIKNPESNHPLYSLYRDIEVEILTPRSISFTLPKTFAFFPQYLTFKIIPKHIWGSIPVQNFAFSEYSLKPIGSGPYTFKKIISAKDGTPLQYLLEAAQTYYLPGPYLRSFSVRFFSSLDEAMNALRKKEIGSLAEVPAATFSQDSPDNFQKINPVIPQSFGLFFNLEAPPLEDKVMRQAINYALPLSVFFENRGQGAIERIDSPIWFIPPEQDIFDAGESEQLLSSLGWKDSDNDGIKDKKLKKKDKNTTPLSLSLTLLDTQEMQAVSSFIKEYLAKVGIDLALKPIDVNEFHSRLRSSSFQVLVVGELPTSGYYPDLYPFFHSSQKPPQGMNFSGYANKNIDALLTGLRDSLDPATRDLDYQEIADILKTDLPAIFLYRPTLTWLVQKTINIPPTDFLNSAEERFSRVNEWYLFTKRTFK